MVLMPVEEGLSCGRSRNANDRHRLAQDGRQAGQGTARIGRFIGLPASDLAGAAMLVAVAAYGL